MVANFNPHIVILVKKKAVVLAILKIANTTNAVNYISSIFINLTSYISRESLRTVNRLFNTFIEHPPKSI
jgi:hypothetical protein